MGARTGGRRIGQLSSQAQPDKAAAFRRWRRVIERHLTQKGSVRKRATEQQGPQLPRALSQTTRKRAGTTSRSAPVNRPAPSTRWIRAESRCALPGSHRAPGPATDAAGAKAPVWRWGTSRPSGAGPILRIAIFGRQRTHGAPYCTGLVIVPIFPGGDLASYTPLADPPTGPPPRASRRPSTRVARLLH
jgi:hypothetical protein